jgi:hypothetical protein
VPDGKESPDLMIIHRKAAKDAKKSTKIFGNSLCALCAFAVRNNILGC